MENGPGLSRCISYLKNGDIPASYVIVYQRVTFSFQNYLGGGFKHCLFSPLPGEMIQFD